MSTSAIGGMRPGAASGGPGTKKKSDCVRPGLFDVRARLARRTSALMRLAFPAIARAAKGTSGGPSEGSAAIFGTSVTSRQGRRKRISLFMRRIAAAPIGSGPCRSLRRRILRLGAPEQALQIAEELDRHVVAPHDHALLQHR